MKNLYFALCLSVICAVLAGCGSSSGVVVTSSTEPQNQTNTPANTFGPGSTYIVHVDERERLVTLRGGLDLEDGFYVAINTSGKETAALKVLPSRVSGMRTAEILEGRPSINHHVRLASASREGELSKLYANPTSDAQ